MLDYVLDESVVDPEDLKVMMHKNSKAAGTGCTGFRLRIWGFGLAFSV